MKATATTTLFDKEFLNSVELNEISEETAQFVSYMCSRPFMFIDKKRSTSKSKDRRIKHYEMLNRKVRI